MFDHIGLGVSDYAASKVFFLDALRPLGVTVVMEGPYGVGMGPPGKPACCMDTLVTEADARAWGGIHPQATGLAADRCGAGDTPVRR